MTDLVHVVLAANHRYLNGLLATMASMILFSTNKNRLCFHVFADGLDDFDCERVKSVALHCGFCGECLFHRPDMSWIVQTFSAYKSAHTAFLRLFLCEFLEEEWVVYSDVDTLWFRDVCELWNGRDSSVSVLWCQDVASTAQGAHEYSRLFNPRFDVDKYACSGVMLMNLKRMRETGFVGKCVDFVSRWGTPPFDQDILNAVCLDDAKLIDQRWDCMRPDRRAPEGVVIHFNGIGSGLNTPFSGWRVHYVMWYRFFYDVILGYKRHPVCGVLKRTIFFLLGSFYPFGWLLRLVGVVFDQIRQDQLARVLFFSWLWRHNQFREHWLMLDKRR